MCRPVVPRMAEAHGGQVHAMERAVERPLFHLENGLRDLLNAPGDCDPWFGPVANVRRIKSGSVP